MIKTLNIIRKIPITVIPIILFILYFSSIFIYEFDQQTEESLISLLSLILIWCLAIDIFRLLIFISLKIYKLLKVFSTKFPNLKLITKPLEFFLFGTFVLVLTIIALSITLHFVAWLFNLLFHNYYIDETILYFLPIIFPVGISVYFFLKKKKGVAIWVIIGGILYYLWIWFQILWASGEGCFPFFYGLLKDPCSW